MLAEHEAGRKLTQKMRQLTERLQGGDIPARQLVGQCGLDYREATTPTSKKGFSPLPWRIASSAVEKQEQMLESFDLFQPIGQGEEFREKYFGLANRLIREISPVKEDISLDA